LISYFYCPRITRIYTNYINEKFLADATRGPGGKVLRYACEFLKTFYQKHLSTPHPQKSLNSGNKKKLKNRGSYNIIFNMEVKMKEKKEKKLRLGKITIQDISVLDSAEQKKIYAGVVGTTQIPIYCEP
jgi:hypothetical protein